MCPLDAPEDDPSHYLPSEVSQHTGRRPGPGRPKGSATLLSSTPTAALAGKVRSLGLIVQQLDSVKVRSSKEGALIANLMQEMLNEADADGCEPAVRQKYYQVVTDAALRVHELHVKAAAECLDLETKRSDTRLKRTMWKEKQGIGKTIPTEGATVTDLADLMRREK